MNTDIRTASEDQVLAVALRVEELSVKTTGNPAGWVDVASLNVAREVIEQAHRDGLVAVNYEHGTIRPA